MRIVFDAKVLVSAFAARGLCADIFEACPSSHECVAAPRILVETEEALRRKVRLPAPRSTAIRRFLEEHLRVVAPAAVEGDACRDPEDLPVLGAALAADADCIVSGDADLLELACFRGIPILRQRALWERISTA